MCCVFIAIFKYLIIKFDKNVELYQRPIDKTCFIYYRSLFVSGLSFNSPVCMHPRIPRGDSARSERNHPWVSEDGLYACIIQS